MDSPPAAFWEFGYSWRGEYGDLLCYFCAKAILPGVDSAYRSGIRTIRVATGPFSGYWDTDPQDTAYALGIPPRCTQCNRYCTNYFVKCIKDDTALLALVHLDSCCCRACRPFIYRDDILGRIYTNN